MKFTILLCINAHNKANTKVNPEIASIVSWSDFFITVFEFIRNSIMPLINPRPRQRLYTDKSNKYK